MWNANLLIGIYFYEQRINSLQERFTSRPGEFAFAIVVAAVIEIRFLSVGRLVPSGISDLLIGVLINGTEGANNKSALEVRNFNISSEWSQDAQGRSHCAVGVTLWVLAKPRRR